MWFGCGLFLIVLGSVLDIRSGVFTCGYLFCVCYLCVGGACLFCRWFIYVVRCGCVGYCLGVLRVLVVAVLISWLVSCRGGLFVGCCFGWQVCVVRCSI